MGFFTRDKTLDAPKVTPVEYLCKLMEENNALQREILVALGRTPSTRMTHDPKPLRTYTDKDVTVVTRADRMREAQAREGERNAPWRQPIPGNGQASDTTSKTTGSKPDAASPDGSPEG